MAEPNFWERLRTRGLNDVRAAVLSPLGGILKSSYGNALGKIQQKVENVGTKLNSTQKPNELPQSQLQSTTQPVQQTKIDSKIIIYGLLGAIAIYLLVKKS